MREPPDKTTVKEPFSLPNLADRSAVYLAKDTARSSSESKTCTFLFLFLFSAAIDDDDDDALILTQSDDLFRLREMFRNWRNEFGLLSN